MQKWIAETKFKGHPQAPFPVCAPSFNAAVTTLTKEGYEIVSLVMCVALDPVINEHLVSMAVSQKETNLAVVDLLTAMKKSQKDTNDRLTNITTAMGSRSFYLRMRSAVCWGMFRFFWILFIMWLLWHLALAVAFESASKYRNPMLPWTWGKPEWTGSLQQIDRDIAEQAPR